MSHTTPSLPGRNPRYWLFTPLLCIAVIIAALMLSQSGVSNVSAMSVVTGADAPLVTPTPGCPPNWTVVDSPNPLTNNYLYAISVLNPNDAWAVGYYYDFNGGSPSGTLITHWDGTTWTQVPGATGAPDGQGRLYGVTAISQNDVWAVGMYYPGTAGQTLIEHWDGTQWTIVPSPNRPGYNELLAVDAISANDVWAVGDSLGNHATLAMHWNGSYWATVYSPPDSAGHDFKFTSVAAVSTNDVWAVGYEDEGSGLSQSLIEHWNGTQWSIVASPNPGQYYDSLYGVTAISANDIWAVGAYSDDGGSTDLTLMVHWDGTSWTQVAGNSTNSYNSLRSVAAASSTDIWAVGLTTNCDLCLQFDTLIEHWDGTQWSVVSSPNGVNQFNRLRGVAVSSPGDVWTVGYTDQYDYPYLSSTLIERQRCAPPPTVTGTPPTATTTATSTVTATPTACSAENTNYVITRSAGATVVPATTDIGLHCDYCAQTVSLPFTFALYGTQFNSAVIGNNGTMGFVSNTNTWRTACLPSQEFSYAILPYWQFLHLDGSNNCPTCGVYTSVEGSAPNRTYNIEWRGYDYFYTAFVNFEVRLHEGNSNFEVAYGSVPSGGNQQVTVGVQKEMGLLYTQYLCESQNGNLTNGTLLTFTQPVCGTGTPTPQVTTTSTRTATQPAATSTRTVTVVPATGTTQPSQTAVSPSSTSTRTSVVSATAVGTSGVTNTPGVMTATATASASATVGTIATVTACAVSFSDVPSDHTFYSYITCLACRGIISGYLDGTFRPGNDITRGQIAKIVSNAAGFSEDAGPQLYEDVAIGSPFYAWVNRLSTRGYMGGYQCGLVPQEPCIAPDNLPYFRPDASATRGQLAKIVANAAGLVGTPAGQFYTDVPDSNPFYLWTMRLTDLGVMSGYQCGGPGEPCDSENRPYFRPFANVTRGQASKIVANTFFPNCQVAARR